jgi:CubicO group peptidase (beta-lactamase class C family)
MSAKRQSAKTTLTAGRGVSDILWAAVALLLVAFAAACAPPGRDAINWPTDEWRTSTPERQDMESARLQEMMDLIDEEGFAYDSILVVRHGRIVFEEYRNGYGPETEHHLQSVTKSFSSTLIGIAIDRGFLEGVDQRLVDLFPGHTIANLDARKERLTLEHLLTMSDGMDWHELDYPYTDPRNTLGQMWTSRDAVQHVLDRPMAREPGEAWAYNSGTSILLGGILEEATGQDVLAFAREVLFEPLGIEKVQWDKTTGDHYHTDGGLYLTPRDMARFGYLVLRDGAWDGEQIVSPEWVARSTETHHPIGAGKGYGYQWWTLEDGISVARGHYEQNIYVVPEADMVVVFTGYIPDDVIPPTDGLLYRYILAACTDLPPTARHRTYANHGFAFDYPRGFSVQEMPLPGRDTISSEAGVVQFQLFAYPFELMEAVWVRTEPDPDLEAQLAGFSEAASQQEGVEFTVGQTRAFAKGEQEALYQPFDFQQQGIRLKGASVAWYCPESQRVVIFSYATNAEVSDSDVAARLQEYLDLLDCHATEASEIGLAGFEAHLETIRQALKIPGMSAAVVRDQELHWPCRSQEPRF